MRREGGGGGGREGGREEGEEGEEEEEGGARGSEGEGSRIIIYTPQFHTWFSHVLMNAMLFEMNLHCLYSVD